MIGLVLSSLVFGLSLLVLVFMRKRAGFTNSNKTAAKWEQDLPQIAGNHTQVTGVLAGFSITIVVLIAALRLEGDQLSLRFLEQSTLGMFMVAFFGYVGAGILFSLVTERSGTHRYCLFSAAGVLYYLSVLLSFSALLPLLELIGATYLRLAISWLVVGSVIGGYMAICIPLVDLLRLRRRLCAVAFALVASITGIYLGLGNYFPSLYRAELILRLNLHSSVIVIVLIFLVCMLSFFYQRLAHETTLTRVTALVAWIGTAIVVFFSSVTILSIGA